MYGNPSTLEEICLNVITDNIEFYIEPIPKKQIPYVEIENGIHPTKPVKKYVFRDPNIYLINRISEQLLATLLKKKILNDATLNLFSSENTTLKKIKLNNIKVTEYGMKILKLHKIIDLECVNIKTISIIDILECLNEWSLDNLISANFSKCRFVDSSSRHCFMDNIIKLKNIRSLNLSYTELNQHTFWIICKDLIHLEKLDISGTLVVDLEPLTYLAHQIKSLGLGDLMMISNLFSTLKQMEQLQHLDLSIIKEKVHILRISPMDSPLVNLFDNNDILPNLVSLDISGWRDYIPKSALQNFLQNHHRLEYLGVVLNDLMFAREFTDVTSPEYPKDLVIGGLGNLQQIKVTLRRYKYRVTYVQKALYQLFQLTNSLTETCTEMFELILPVMEVHLNQSGRQVQMAATACLYNLTHEELAKQIHPSLLSKAIDLTLNAMAAFPKEHQLQKNSLFTLCNDRILQEANFDRFRCAELVLNAFCAFCDNSISRMAVAICSIIAAKISTEETSKLGARPIYMRKLLEMVEKRVNTNVSDITLKFTLSALWNLTDESPTTSVMFLELKGANLFLNVLQTFQNDNAIETKVLGLLNNIAEVSSLRENLMIDELIDKLYILVKSENIDVSYFAAGIVAHLASDGEEKWAVSCHTRDEMLEALKDSINQWQIPQSEMVSYRSFRPFLSLLGVDKDYRVQMWALWAVQHVCSKNPSRYCVMLQEEKGHDLLCKLRDSTGSHPLVKRISADILDTIQNYESEIKGNN